MYIRVMHHKSVMGWDEEESGGVLGVDAKMVHMQGMNLLFSHIS